MASNAEVPIVSVVAQDSGVPEVGDIDVDVTCRDTIDVRLCDETSAEVDADNECVVCDDTMGVPLSGVVETTGANDEDGATEVVVTVPDEDRSSWGRRRCRRPSQPWPAQHCCKRCAQGLVGSTGHGPWCTGVRVWFEDVPDPMVIVPTRWLWSRLATGQLVVPVSTWVGERLLDVEGPLNMEYCFRL